jgi:hypothetical protein
MSWLEGDVVENKNRNVFETRGISYCGKLDQSRQDRLN